MHIQQDDFRKGVSVETGFSSLPKDAKNSIAFVPTRAAQNSFRARPLSCHVLHLSATVRQDATRPACKILEDILDNHRWLYYTQDCAFLQLKTKHSNRFQDVQHLDFARAGCFQVRVGIPRSPAVLHREAAVSGPSKPRWSNAAKPMQVREVRASEVPATPNTMPREAWIFGGLKHAQTPSLVLEMQ